MQALDESGARQRFQADLVSGERLFWVGQPDPSVTFTRADLFLVPFSIIWGGFSLVFAGVLVASLVSSGSRADALFPLLFAVPFVVVGQYMIWGRFLYKGWLKRRTFYGVTNQRVLVLSGPRANRLQGAFISQIPVINRTLRQRGAGTLEFGSLPPHTAYYANTGMDFFGWSAAQVPVFYDIRDVQRVYDLVLRLRREAGAGQAAG